MTLDSKLGLKVAGGWLVLWGLNGLGIFDIGSIFGPLMPLLAIIAGILILIR